MRRLILAAAVASLVVGCTPSNNRQANGQIDPDSPLISDTEEPNIDFDTYIAAGRLAESRGQLGGAAMQYDHALALRPTHLPTLRKLAVLQTQLGAVDPALATWKRYLAASNEAADAFGGLGYSYELARQPDEAERTYQAGIAKFPDNQLVRVNYGLMLARDGKTDEAKTQLSAVLKPAEVEYNLASVYEQQGKKADAQTHYKMALELDPKLTAAKTRMAQIE